MSNTGYSTLYNSAQTDLINIFDTSNPGTTTTGYYSTSNGKDLGKVFTPYVYGAITTNYKYGGTDLGSLFARSGYTSKYSATGSYSVSSGGGYNTIITFTGNGTLTLNTAPTSNSVLLVGGGGGAGCVSGGGAAGLGVGSLSLVTGSPYSINIGLGGAGTILNNSNWKSRGNSGTDSTITLNGTIIETAYGGGGGVGWFDSFPTSNNDMWSFPFSGGSGGGSMGVITAASPMNSTNGNTGNAGPATKGSGNLIYYGNPGGSGYISQRGGNPAATGAGGGGAGGAGGNATLYTNSGATVTTTIYYAGAGGYYLNNYSGDGSKTIGTGGAGYTFAPTGLTYATGGNGNYGEAKYIIATKIGTSWIKLGVGDYTSLALGNGTNAAANTGNGGSGSPIVGYSGSTYYSGNGGSGVCIFCLNL